MIVWKAAIASLMTLGGGCILGSPVGVYGDKVSDLDKAEHGNNEKEVLKNEPKIRGGHSSRLVDAGQDENTDSGWVLTGANEEDYENLKKNNGQNKGRGPTEVSITTRGNRNSKKGDVDVSDYSDGFSNVKTVKLQGLAQNPNQPVVFKKKELDVPYTQLFSFGDNGESVGQDAEPWYGEGVGQYKDTSVLLLIGSNGVIVGSATDNVVSYIIQTTEEEIGGNSRSKKITFNAYDLEDEPHEDDSPEEDVWSVVSSTERKLFSSANQMGLQRSLKMVDLDLRECQDLYGFNGLWYDSDGSTYDCNWYEGGSRCSSYGSNYANFGFTANQACCVCGGGSTVSEIIDLAVVYTSAALQGAGGFNQMQNLINLSVFQTNVALSNSETGVKIRLVETADVSSHFAEPSTNDRADDQILDMMDASQAITDLQNRVGADIVGLICGTDNCVGMAANVGEQYTCASVSDWGCDYRKGLFVSRDYRSALLGDYTFAHEIGHILGGFHDGEGGGGGWGDCNQCFKTLMSYPRFCQDRGLCNDLTRAWEQRLPSILYFSNPDINYSGIPIGTANANNAGNIRNEATTIAAWQPTRATSVQLCMHYPCEDSPYFVALHGESVEMASMPPEIGDDHVSAIKVPAGYAIVWYEHANFEGRFFYNGNPLNEMTLDIGSYLGNGVSSFKVRKVSGQVRLYQYYLAGGIFTVPAFGIWNTMPSIIGDNQLSSVWIPRGYRIWLYEDPNLQNLQDFWTCETRENCVLYLYGDDNNVVSSFKVDYVF